MEYSRAGNLSQAWGDKPCSHPQLVKEYFLGMKTGDLVCTTCGRDFVNFTEAKEDAQKYEE